MKSKHAPPSPNQAVTQPHEKTTISNVILPEDSDDDDFIQDEVNPEDSDEDMDAVGGQSASVNEDLDDMNLDMDDYNEWKKSHHPTIDDASINTFQHLAQSPHITPKRKSSSLHRVHGQSSPTEASQSNIYSNQ